MNNLRLRNRIIPVPGNWTQPARISILLKWLPSRVEGFGTRRYIGRYGKDNNAKEKSDSYDIVYTKANTAIRFFFPLLLYQIIQRFKFWFILTYFTTLVRSSRGAVCVYNKFRHFFFFKKESPFSAFQFFWLRIDKFILFAITFNFIF